MSQRAARDAGGTLCTNRQDIGFFRHEDHRIGGSRPLKRLTLRRSRAGWLPARSIPHSRSLRRVSAPLGLARPTHRSWSVRSPHTRTRRSRADEGEPGNYYVLNPPPRPAHRTPAVRGDDFAPLRDEQGNMIMSLSARASPFANRVSNESDPRGGSGYTPRRDHSQRSAHTVCAHGATPSRLDRDARSDSTTLRRFVPRRKSRCTASK